MSFREKGRKEDTQRHHDKTEVHQHMPSKRSRQLCPTPQPALHPSHLYAKLRSPGVQGPWQSIFLSSQLSSHAVAWMLALTRTCTSSSSIGQLRYVLRHLTLLCLLTFAVYRLCLGQGIENRACGIKMHKGSCQWAADDTQNTRLVSSTKVFMTWISTEDIGFQIPRGQVAA